jgi:hypothetical protein
MFGAQYSSKIFRQKKWKEQKFPVKLRENEMAAYKKYK